MQAAEIKGLLEERPEVNGIAVADTPPGLPVIGILGFENDPYDVVVFDNVGKTEIYAICPKQTFWFQLFCLHITLF